MSAALFSAIGNARTLLVEKTGLLGGTSALSAGSIWIANTRHAAATGESDSAARVDKYLRQIVERILATDALPILATKADNIETDWKLNIAIAQVAYDYDLPLVNVWRSVQNLPNQGLEAPKNIYLSGDGWMRRNRIWLQTLDLTRLALSGK